MGEEKYLGGKGYQWYKLITKFFLWLDDFSFGYTHLAFEAAARDGFAHNIKIVPSAHHYADYFEPGVDVVIRFGQPISLSDYYELYKTKPRTAQRQVNELVRMPFFFILTVLACGLACGC
jgi:1-acyl-sn-glycerol-3-phosphate acyltransferase